MTVIATSQTSQTLPLGGVWTLAVCVLDADGEASPDLPVVTITLPGGTTTSPTATDESAGAYRALYTVGSAGRYVARVVASGYGAADFTAYVGSVVAETAMPDITDVDAYLGEHSWTDDQLQDALDAESSAQRDVCRVPADYPDSLRQALLRRCARNLAMRTLPLAVLRGDGEGGDSSFLPGRDPEVRRFEAPYRKVVMG